VTAVARLVAVVVGVAGLVVGMAALVRAAVLAAEPGLEWSGPAWWTSVTGGPGLATSITAAVVAVVAIVLIILAVRQLRLGSGRPVIEFGGADGRARLDVHALEKALQRSVREHVEGAGACRVALTKEPDGWFVRVEAQLPGRDLLGVQERVTRLLRDDLDRLGGVRLEGVDLVVSAVLGTTAKSAAAPARSPSNGSPAHRSAASSRAVKSFVFVNSSNRQTSTSFDGPERAITSESPVICRLEIPSVAIKRRSSTKA
jgi:hypothetical protein